MAGCNRRRIGWGGEHSASWHSLAQVWRKARRRERHKLPVTPPPPSSARQLGDIPLLWRVMIFIYVAQIDPMSRGCNSLVVIFNRGSFHYNVLSYIARREGFPVTPPPSSARQSGRVMWRVMIPFTLRGLTPCQEAVIVHLKVLTGALFVTMCNITVCYHMYNCT